MLGVSHAQRISETSGRSSVTSGGLARAGVPPTRVGAPAELLEACRIEVQGLTDHLARLARAHLWDTVEKMTRPKRRTRAKVDLFEQTKTRMLRRVAAIGGVN